MAVSGTNKGKSGGARVITYVFLTNETIYLTDIYLKSEQDTIERPGPDLTPVSPGVVFLYHRVMLFMSIYSFTMRLV